MTQPESEQNGTSSAGKEKTIPVATMQALDFLELLGT